MAATIDSMECDQLTEPAAFTIPQGRIIRKLRIGWGTDGLLHHVVPEGDDYIIACVGKAAILLPNGPLKTKGGQVDLRNWVGQEIEIKNVDGTLRTRLMPVNEDKMRVLELEEVLADLIGNFAEYDHAVEESGSYHSGGVSALIRAFQMLGLPEGFRGEELTKFWKASQAKEARAQAEAAVVVV